MTQQAFADVIEKHLKDNPSEGQPDTVSRGAVGNWEGGKPVGLRNLRAISERFNVSFDWLANNRGETPAIIAGGGQELLSPPPMLPGVRHAEMVELPFPASRPMIDIQGVAMGSIVHQFEGLIIEAQVIDRIPCPPHLMGVKGIYGIYVEGESMSPMHNPGEPRIVHPGRPVLPGDSVVVQTRHWNEDPGQGYIKLFRRRKGESILLEQLNPKITLEIPVKYVVSIHHVLTMSEVLGL